MRGGCNLIPKAILGSWEHDEPTRLSCQTGQVDPVIDMGTNAMFICEVVDYIPSEVIFGKR